VVKKAKEQAKKERLMKKRRKILRKIKDKDGTFMTGAGLHLDDISDDEDKKFTGLEEDNTYEDIMAEIKRDVFKWKNVRVDSERNLTR
jgi:hypothetical protein